MSLDNCLSRTHVWRGLQRAAQGRQTESEIALFIVAGRLTLLPFEEADAREAADIRAHLRRLARPIGHYDVLIAAQARRAGAALVTANSGGCGRCAGADRDGLGGMSDAVMEGTMTIL